MNPYKKAVAHKLKLKLLLMGESGTGKTWCSLSLATRLIDLDGGRIAFIDTEGANGKAQLYAPYFDFDHLTLTDHSPESYIKAINAAIQYKYTVVIVDSFSQEWNGAGGILEITDKAKTGWAESKPRHHKLISTIHDSDIHIIGTVRTKNSYAKTATGAIDWKNSSIEARQEPEFEYEWDMSAILDHDHTLTIRKSRCFELPNETQFSTDQQQTEFVFQLHTWINAGDTPPHWTENPRQLERVKVWAEQARSNETYALHIAGAMGSIDKTQFDTPEAYVDALKDYCSPQAVLQRAKDREEAQKQPKTINRPPLTVVPSAEQSEDEESVERVRFTDKTGIPDDPFADLKETVGT